MSENEKLRQKGKILSGVGGLYKVLAEDGRVLECRARGNFRFDKISPYPGDNVTVTEEKNAGNVGKTLTVLTDGFDTVAEVYYGRTYADAPDVDGKVYFTSKRKINAGAFVEVKITEALDYDLVGVVE